MVMDSRLDYLVEIFILVTSASLVLAGDDTVRLNDGDEGLNIYDRLFRPEDSKYTSWTPKETLDRLKRLVAIYDTNSYDIGEPAYSKENQKLLRDLLSVFMDRKCSKENIEKYSDYIKSLSIYGNLVRALMVYREEQYQKCRSIFTGSLFSSINSIGSEQKAKLFELRDGIIAHSDDYYEGFPYYTAEALNESVLRYLAKNPGQFREKWKKAKMLPIEDLSQLYVENIVPVCSNLNQSFKNSMQFYINLVANDKSLYKTTDGMTQGWIMIGIMCNDLRDAREKIIANVHNLMYKYAHPKRRSPFKWIRDMNKEVKDLS